MKTFFIVVQIILVVIIAGLTVYSAVNLVKEYIQDRKDYPNKYKEFRLLTFFKKIKKSLDKS